MSTPNSEVRSAMVIRAVLVLLFVMFARTAIVQAQVPGEQVEYYAYDAVGSVRVVFNASGAVVGRGDYLPFGEELPSNNGLPNQRFTGHERDPEAGLDYFEARGYQVRHGRFAQPDPVFADALDNPQRWNRYAYALNNPVLIVDPDGRNAAADCHTVTGVIEVDGQKYYVSDGTCVSGGGGGGGKGGGSRGGETRTATFAGWFVERLLDMFTMASPVGGRESELVPTSSFRYVPDKDTEMLIDAGLFVAAVILPGNQVSYLRGVEVKAGTPGSVKLDIVQGSRQMPEMIFDLKTGGATLTPARINEIRAHLPNPNIPIVQLKPKP